MSEHQWYYLSSDFLGNSQMVGPIPEAEILSLTRNAKLAKSTQVMSPSRTKGAWHTLEQVPGLKKTLEQGEAERKQAKQQAAEDRRQRQLAVVEERRNQEDLGRYQASQLSDSQDVELIRTIAERVKPILTTQEQLEFIAVQEKPIVNIAPDGVVVTNRRLIFYRPKILGRFEFQDYQWFDLFDAHFEKKLMGVTFWARHVSGRVVMMEYLPLAAAQRIYRVAQEREEQARWARHKLHVDTIRAGASQVNVQNNIAAPTSTAMPAAAPALPAAAVQPAALPAPRQSDLLQRLATLKAMFDQQLITAEDYERRKQEILSQV
jgi:hypothetical protein